jgi:hypothetical protein
MITKIPYVSLQLFFAVGLCGQRLLSATSWRRPLPSYPNSLEGDHRMAILGSLLGTVDGLLGAAGGAAGSATGSTGVSTSTDTSHTLDLGALIEAGPSVDANALGVADVSASAPAAVGVNADDGHLDLGSLLHGLL